MKKLLNSFKEVLVSILPMTVLIMIISGIWAPFTSEMLVSFIGGAIMMMIGLALFLFGADISMMEVGERVGSFLVSRRSLKILIAAGFFVGMFVTIAEPEDVYKRQVVIRFSDNGAGIPPDILPKIFDRFYTTRGEKNDSQGLGLFIVRYTIKAHGGTIEVVSEMGEGTTFTIRLKTL